jgi:hypothetical protein
MKGASTFLLILSAFFSSYPQADYNNFTHYYGIQINTGITFFNLQPLKNSFSRSVEAFSREYNIPLEVQTLYPSNIIWSGYLFWYFSQNTSLIIGPEYTSTGAYSMYEDYAGTLDIKSGIKMYYLYLGFRVHIVELPIVQPFMGVNVGIAKTDIEMETNLNINNGQIVDNYKSEDSDTGYSIEPCLGGTYSLSPIVFELVLAYKFVNLQEFEIKPNSFNVMIGVKFGVYK